MLTKAQQDAADPSLEDPSAPILKKMPTEAGKEEQPAQKFRKVITPNRIEYIPEPVAHPQAEQKPKEDPFASLKKLQVEKEEKERKEKEDKERIDQLEKQRKEEE